MTNPLYLSPKWERKRNKILRRDEYLCQESKRYGRTESAEVIHHIYPVEEYPELAFEEWNLLPVTHRSHNSFHKRNSHELTDKGLYWQDKRRREFENYYNPPHLENEK
ncbi:HNH endonuclease [Listeria goaensis]|uniref:HNH endonuclease n=1 Tax=Listeria goaensis TaxID=1649188 RepID=UPI000B59133C|nr:nuclease [Listeria goaensis]